MKHRDPASDAALQRYWAEQRERGRARQRFEEGLIKDFELPDREKLIEFLSVAELSYEVALRDGPGGDWSLEEADGLDALSSALWKTVKLLYSLEHPLAIQLAGVTRDEQMEHYAELREREREVRELADRLAGIGYAAAKIPRRRRRRGQRKVHITYNRQRVEFDTEPLRALLDVVAGYWTVTLGRPFAQNQTAWEPDGTPMGKAPDAVRFAYAVIEHIAPGQGQALKTIAREYTPRGKGALRIIIPCVPD